MEEALMAQGEAIRKKQYPYRVVDGYRGVDLLLCVGWVDHRDYPGLVLTCVCDGTRTRLGSGYPKRRGSIFQNKALRCYG